MNLKQTPGELISDIVLIDNYSLMLRCGKIRTSVNSKLGLLKFDGVSAQVIVNEYDSLVLSFKAKDDITDIYIHISERMDVDDSKKSSKEKVANFITNINQAIASIKNMIKKMKKNKKNVASTATLDELENKALDLAKMINLYRSENGTLLEKLGVDISEVFRKYTNGIIDSVVVDEGVFTFLNSRIGAMMSFNSIGHADTEIIHVVMGYIKSMTDLCQVVMPLDDRPVEPKAYEKDSIENSYDGSAKEVKQKMSKKVVLYKTQEPIQVPKDEYNKLIKKTFDSLDINETDKVSSFSQIVRLKMEKCAKDAGLNLSDGASLQKLMKRMTADNIQKVKDTYVQYDQKQPAWFVKIGGQSVPQRRRKRIK